MSSLLERARSIPRGVDTIQEWLGEGAVAVDPKTAQARADVCLQCPMNRIGSITTHLVAQAIKRHVEFKNNVGLRVSGEKKLGECSVCLCQLRLKVHVPIGIVRRQMTPEESEKFPSPCWQIDEPLT